MVMDENLSAKISFSLLYMRKLSLDPKTETFDFQSNMRCSHISPRLRRWENAFQGHLKTETSRLDYIPGF